MFRLAALHDPHSRISERWRGTPPVRRFARHRARSRVSLCNQKRSFTSSTFTHDPAYEQRASDVVALRRTRRRRVPFLAVPMLKDDELIGVLIIYPPGSPRLHRQADRVSTNFAAQAVIAIENARLLTELREVAGAADGDVGCAARNFKLARRSQARVRRDAGKCHAHLRGQIRRPSSQGERSATCVRPCTSRLPLLNCPASESIFIRRVRFNGAGRDAVAGAKCKLCRRSASQAERPRGRLFGRMRRRADPAFRSDAQGRRS